MKRFIIAAASTALPLCISMWIVLILTACHGGGMPAPGPGVGTSAAPAWGMAGGGPMRQGQSTYSGPDTPEIAWEYVTAGPLEGTPALAQDGSVYISARRVLLAFNESGELRWRHSNSGRITGGPYLTADGSILVAYHDGIVERLDPDGTTRWETEISGVLYGPSALFDADGFTYALGSSGTGSRWIIAIDPAGDIAWESPEHQISRLYSIVGGRIYCATQDYLLMVFNTDGIFQWYLPENPDVFEYFVGGTPQHGAYTLRVDYDSREVELLYYDDRGEMAWKEPVDVAAMTNPTVDRNGNAYILSSIRSAFVYTPEGEALETSFSHIESVAPGPENSTYIYGRDKEGTALFQVDSNVQVIARIGDYPRLDRYWAVAGGYLAVNSPDGIGDENRDQGLYVLSLSGQVLWSFEGAYGKIESVVCDQLGAIHYSDNRALFQLDADSSMASRNLYSISIGNSLVIGPQGYLVFCDSNHFLHTIMPDGDQISDASIGGAGDPHSLAVTAKRYYIPSEFLLYGVNPQGKQEFVYAAQADLYGGAAIGADATAYFCDVNGARYAVGSDGKEYWRIDSEAMAWGYPVVAGDSQILFAAEDGMAALDPDGSQRWSLAVAEGRVWPQPAVAADGTIYAPVDLQPDSAEIGSAGQSDVTNTASMGEGTSAAVAALATPASSLQDVELPGICALNANGELLWYLHTASIELQPVVDNRGRIYIFTQGSDVRAISPAGEELWSQDIRWFESSGTKFMCISPQNRIIAVTGEVVTAVGP